MTLQINGFWPEDDAPVKDSAFACAFAFGLIRFAKFLDVRKMDIKAIHPPLMRKEMKAIIKKSTEIQV
jgi:hypothetical protein